MSKTKALHTYRILVQSQHQQCLMNGNLVYNVSTTLGNTTSTDPPRSGPVHRSVSHREYTTVHIGHGTPVQYNPGFKINSAAIHSYSPRRNTQCTQEPIFHYFTSQRQEQTVTAAIAT